MSPTSERAELEKMTGADRQQYAADVNELRALTLWADIQNAAQFLGRQVDASHESWTGVGITVCMSGGEFDLVSAFAKVAGGAVGEQEHTHAVTGRPSRIRYARVVVKGVAVEVLASREVTP